MELNIVISGASGLVGSAIAKHLQKEGHKIFQLVRGKKATMTDIEWDIKKKTIDMEMFEKADVVIHLAGANISHRWTKEYKDEIYNSRVEGTRFLSETMAQMEKKPRLFLSASAIGIYGNQPPDKELDEQSAYDDDFLAKVCKDWEAATQKAREASIRTVLMRFGVVLSKNGGAIGKMLLPFKMGVGGKLGDGKQMMSWIALDEIPHIVSKLIASDDISGPVNCVSPKPVSNLEFTKALGEVIHRPTVLPVPGFGVKLLFGEMGEALLLGGQKVLPKRLSQANYQFRYPEIKSALEQALA